MKTRFSPRFKSYVCSERPTEVVIWKVVLPSGSEVNGTLVGDTSPTVYSKYVSQAQDLYKVSNTYPERRKYFRLAHQWCRALPIDTVDFLALGKWTIVSTWEYLWTGHLDLSSRFGCLGEQEWCCLVMLEWCCTKTLRR